MIARGCSVLPLCWKRIPHGVCLGSRDAEEENAPTSEGGGTRGRPTDPKAARSGEDDDTDAAALILDMA
jgi:hypothetical protein